jgi:uncharacterized protein YceK
MNRPLLAAICLSLAAFVLSGCASRMAFPDDAEAWGHEPSALTR